MSFFVDPTISTLTSGTPSQNVDLAGISFPRRIGFRIASKYAEDFRLTGATAVWQAYKDDTFSEKSSLGADFHYEGLIDRTNWSLFYLKGIFPTNITYLKCTISNTTTGMNITSFYFKFEKTYQTSLSGMTYVTDPVLGTKIPKNGILYELRPTAKMINGKRQFAGFKEAHKQYKIKQITNIDNLSVAIVKQPVITQTLVRYSEKPKMVFLVTPPHLMSYAKIILILISQLVDLNFEQSYMTEKNQKPLYKTRFMLDELGNLQSDKHGIANFQTLLSIGLGQDQQFTLILQTLQQLKDVYGVRFHILYTIETSHCLFVMSRYLYKS